MDFNDEMRAVLRDLVPDLTDTQRVVLAQLVLDVGACAQPTQSVFVHDVGANPLIDVDEHMIETGPDGAEFTVYAPVARFTRLDRAVRFITKSKQAFPTGPFHHPTNQGN